MNIRLHKNARTTPATRREIQQASGSDYEPANPSSALRQPESVDLPPNTRVESTTYGILTPEKSKSL